MINNIDFEVIKLLSEQKNFLSSKEISDKLNKPKNIIGKSVHSLLMKNLLIRRNSNIKNPRYVYIIKKSRESSSLLNNFTHKTDIWNKYDHRH